MLQKLFIKNYALIEELEMVLSPNMTMITGETGAGKSIILGALSLILGHRVATTAVANQKVKCIVEGTFDIRAHQLDAFFEDNELDYESETIIRREISPSGKSRAFINDTPVNLQILKSLSERLVSLHAQHQTLHLFDAEYHLFIIDTLAGHTDRLEKYKKLYSGYQKNTRKLKKLEAANAQMKRDMDYIKFQLSEFEEAQLENPNEQDDLEKELHQLDNAESIKTILSTSVHMLSEQEPSLLEQLKVSQRSLIDLAKYNNEVGELLERMESVVLELEDITQELDRLESDVTVDPEKAAQISARLNIIFRLQQKHQVQTVQELMDLESDLIEQSQSVEAGDLEIEVLKKTIEQQQQKLIELAQKISAKRQKQFPSFEKTINKLLNRVGMPHATIETSHQQMPEGQLGSSGIDQVEILFSANKGMPHAELRKVASGGELSRLMLCVQSLIADNTALPTLVFDEIDTGISGEVARKVGIVMQELADAHQVICITHLPQIASMGDKHYFVYKHNTADRTFTKIRALEPEARVVEIAKMLSGDEPGAMAIANARELLSD